jgi:hypothetical protein
MPDINPEDLPPIAPENLGRTGYGELKGELRSIWSGPVDEFDDFPADISKLERGRWYPYSRNDEYPPFVSTSAEQNRRIWTDAHMERLLDHSPVYEVHASELPDYHYFPSILNEVDHKMRNPPTEVSREYTEDVTDVPRFFRSGIPKLPLYEQDWYVPRLSDGRFDWKENIRKNGYSAGLFSAKGWNQRFLAPVNRPVFIGFHMGVKQYAQLPTYFRSFENNSAKRVVRQSYSSTFDKQWVFIGLYWGALLYLGTADGHWNQMVWDNDPFNYDITYCMNYRSKGGFHGII